MKGERWLAHDCDRTQSVAATAVCSLWRYVSASK